jgi:hypothetical protein
VDPYVAISSQAVQGCQPRNFCQPCTRLSTPQFLFEAMGSHDGLLVCSDRTAGLACRNMFYSAGTAGDAGWGHQCWACEVYQEHDLLYRSQAAQLNLLASGRSTSRLLHLFRGEYLLHRLADMSSGTLESAMQKYLVRLRRINLRLILSGRAYGFRPVF